MPDLASAPAARQTVTMKARLAAAGLTHGPADPAQPPPAAGAGEPASSRVAEARSRAGERRYRQRQMLRAAAITVRYCTDRTVLTVENHACLADAGRADAGRADAGRADAGPETTAEHHPPALAGAGGGHGLAAMRERAQRAGGTARAGPAPDGWLVEVEIPA